MFPGIDLKTSLYVISQIIEQHCSVKNAALLTLISHLTNPEYVTDMFPYIAADANYPSVPKKAVSWSLTRSGFPKAKTILGRIEGFVANNNIDIKPMIEAYVERLKEIKEEETMSPLFIMFAGHRDFDVIEQSAFMEMLANFCKKPEAYLITGIAEGADQVAADYFARRCGWKKVKEFIPWSTYREAAVKKIRSAGGTVIIAEGHNDPSVKKIYRTGVRKLFARTAHCVDSAEFVVCAISKQEWDLYMEKAKPEVFVGGTGFTIRYALKTNKKVIICYGKQFLRLF